MRELTLINKVLLIYIFLTVATLMAFRQVNHFDFINYDDPDYITENSHIQDGLTMDGIRWSFTTGHNANWHPLTWISHMMDVQLFGLNPHRHHLINLLFHITNTLLLFFVLHRMTKAPWQSAFVAALFALHPQHVESVAWVSERKDVLSAFFWMLTMGAYSYYVERPGPRRYLPVLLFFILGLMAKPMLVTLPFVLLLLDYWPLRRFGQEKTGAKVRLLFREKIPLFTLTALSSVVTYIVQQRGGAVQSIDNFPLGHRISNVFISYLTYIGKMIWPDNLAFFYPYPVQWQLWKVAGAVLILAAITSTVIWTAKRFRSLAVGWFWYAGTLVPVIGLVQAGEQARADRYTYIPLIGLFIMAAWTIPELLGEWRHRKKVLLGFSTLILSGFFIVTWTQAGYWQSNLTLCDHALKVTDNNYIAYYNRGNDYLHLGNCEQAIEDFNRVIELNPKYVLAYANRGNADAALGDYNKAVEDFNRAIELNPKYVLAYANRGNAYAALGDYNKAVEDFNKAIGIDPEYALAYGARGHVYAVFGNYMQAIQDYGKSIEINPKFAEAHYNRGNAYTRLGNQKQALEDYNRAIEINPEYANAYTNRGNAYAALGDYSKAIADYGKAIGISPGNALAYVNRGRAYEVLGHYKQAVEDLKAAAVLGDKTAQNLLRNRGLNR